MVAKCKRVHSATRNKIFVFMVSWFFSHDSVHRSSFGESFLKRKKVSCGLKTANSAPAKNAGPTRVFPWHA
jgi:hypothetical protein